MNEHTRPKNATVSFTDKAEVVIQFGGEIDMPQIVVDAESAKKLGGTIASCASRATNEQEATHE